MWEPGASNPVDVHGKPGTMLSAGDQILVQVHLINTRNLPLTGRTVIWVR